MIYVKIVGFIVFIIAILFELIYSIDMGLGCANNEYLRKLWFAILGIIVIIAIFSPK